MSKVYENWQNDHKEKNIWSFTKFSQIIIQGNVWRPVWRISMWILGLKRLIACATCLDSVSSEQHYNVKIWGLASRLYYSVCVLWITDGVFGRISTVVGGGYFSHASSHSENVASARRVLLLTTQFKIFFSWLFFILFIHCISIHNEQVNTIMFGDTNAIFNLLGKKSREIKIQGEKSPFLYFL